MISDVIKENIETVYNLGGLRYSVEKCAIVLNIPFEDLKKEYDNKDSLFYKSYNRGIIMAQYAIDLAVFNAAKNGDAKSIAIFKQRKRKA